MYKMLVFPGQGAQTVGMGKDLYDNFAIAKDVFHAVDEALGQKLSDIIFYGSEQDLTLTQNTQPALMAVSMAVWEVLKSVHGVSIHDFQYAAGHSLGEYSALCAAGVFSLEDTARLLRIRGEAMQQAVPVGVGAMAAILGLSFTDVEKIAQQGQQDDEVCQAANDNSDGQTVISGHKQAIERVAELAKQAGAKRVVMLPVSAPFHCRLMQPAADTMAQALEHVLMNTASIPVVTNVLVEPTTDQNVIKKSLIDQVTGRVRWRETMDWANNIGVTHIYELGAGKVLSTLCKRAVTSATSVSLTNSEEIRNIQIIK